MSEPFPPIALQRRHAKTVRYITSSHKIDYIIMIKNFQNPEGHQIPSVGQKIRPFYLRGGFGLLVELHREGSDPAACAAGLFSNSLQIDSSQIYLLIFRSQIDSYLYLPPFNFRNIISIQDYYDFTNLIPIHNYFSKYSLICYFIIEYIFEV